MSIEDDEKLARILQEQYDKEFSALPSSHNVNSSTSSSSNRGLPRPILPPPPRSASATSARPQGTLKSLSMEQKLRFAVDGFVVIPQIVPHLQISSARRFIHHHMGERNSGLVLTSDPLTNFASAGSGDKAITDLFNKTDVIEYVHTLLYGNDPGDEGEIRKSKTSGGQIALRYPQLGDPPPSNHRLGGMGWHIDGMDKGTHSTFDLLVGVCLSDQSVPFSGNLILHPGSHHTIHNRIKLSGLPCWPEPSEAISVGMQLRELMKVDLGEPVQMLLNPGDCVIVHQKTGHAGSVNYYHEIRNMVYFRVSHRLLKERGDRILQDVFYNLEGLHDVVK